MPGDHAPVLQREKMMVAAREVGAEDQGEIACGTRGWERADFAAAARAEISTSRGPGMACAKRRGGIDDSGGEAHHEEGGFDRRLVLGVIGGSSWWCGGAHEEITVVGFIENDGVGFGRRERRVGARDEGAADCDLGCKADDAAGYVGGYKSGDGAVDISWVGRNQGAVENEDLTGAVGGGVTVMAFGYERETVWLGRERERETYKRAARLISRAF